MKEKIKRSFYTNGVKTILLSEFDEIPDGFHKGRTFKVNTWNKGLTKDTDERVLKYSKSVSDTLKGNVPWNKNLTKETDNRLKVIAEHISEAFKNNPREVWNKGIPMKEESRKKLSESCRGRKPWNIGLIKESSESILSTSQKLKGHKDFCKDWKAAKLKEFNTKKENNSFNKSDPEDKFYQKLLEKYDEDDIIRQYHEDRYKFDCDFYIKSEDLFIEYQGTWLHGTHPFNENDPEDIKLLEELEQKAKDKNSNFYKSAIYIWTDLDVRKLNEARNNKLNFMFVYPNNLIIDK